MGRTKADMDRVSKQLSKQKLKCLKQRKDSDNEIQILNFLDDAQLSSWHFSLLGSFPFPLYFLFNFDMTLIQKFKVENKTSFIYCFH